MKSNENTDVVIIEKIDLPIKVDGRKKNGGKRAGAGKKAGSVSVATVIKSMELADVQISIKGFARKLINSQTAQALGTWQMAVISRDGDGKLKYVRVSDENEIQRLLEEGIHGKDYVIIAGKDPDWKAASDLLNRAGLKPKDDADPLKGAVNIFNLIHTSEKKHGNDS